MTTNNQLWYTRRGKEIRGPFPKKLIGRYLLIGRVMQSDEVSVDQRNWRPVASLPELIPEELKADLSIPDNQEKLRLARLREDERRYGDRRQLNGPELEEVVRKRRSGKERRESETIETLRHRLIKTQTSEIIRPQKKSLHVFALLMVLGVMAVLGAALLYSPPPPPLVAVNHCKEPARPQVDWSNCRFEGVQLAAADLRGANLQNTSMIGAKLNGADLSNAQMSYSVLLNADAHDVNLTHATLVGAVLRRADLTAANIQGGDLRYAILQGVNLSDADLRDANLAHVILTGANITAANFTGAKLDGAIWLDNTLCAPESIGRCIPAGRLGRE